MYSGSGYDPASMGSGFDAGMGSGYDWMYPTTAAPSVCGQVSSNYSKRTHETTVENPVDVSVAVCLIQEACRVFKSPDINQGNDIFSSVKWAICDLVQYGNDERSEAYYGCIIANSISGSERNANGLSNNILN